MPNEYEYGITHKPAIVKIKKETGTIAENAMIFKIIAFTFVMFSSKT